MTPRPPRSSSRRPAPSSPSSKFAYFGSRDRVPSRGRAHGSGPFLCACRACAACTHLRVRASSVGEECGRILGGGAPGAGSFSAYGVECAHRVRWSPHWMRTAEKCGRPPGRCREVRAFSRPMPRGAGGLPADAEKCGRPAGPYRRAVGPASQGTTEPSQQGSSRQHISAGRLSERENILENGRQVKAFH